MFTSDRRQSKMLLTIDERGPKSLETVFSIVIGRQFGDKWQSKTLFLTIFDLRSSIVLAYPITAYRCDVWIIIVLAWSAWGAEGPCSTSCGGSGFKERLRTCSTGNNNDCSTNGSRYWEVLICDNGACGPSKWVMKHSLIRINPYNKGLDRLGAFFLLLFKISRLI